MPSPDPMSHSIAAFSLRGTSSLNESNVNWCGASIPMQIEHDLPIQQQLNNIHEEMDYRATQIGYGAGAAFKGAFDRLLKIPRAGYQYVTGKVKALKNSLSDSPRIEKVDSFSSDTFQTVLNTISQFKMISLKNDGITAGGVYEDVYQHKWLIKEPQKRG